MMQTIFKEGQIVPQTKKEKLLILRHNYYIQLVREVKLLRIRIRDKIISYRQMVKELDEELRRIK